METILVANVHQTKKKVSTTITTTTKKKKKPIKVVYISNPKKFNTSATQFRALVQQLTGQDSDPTKFVDPYYDHDVRGHHHHQTDETPPLDDVAGDGDDHHQVFSLDSTTTVESPPDPPPPPPLAPVLLAEPFDEYEYDDVFMLPHQHQTFEDNLSGFIFSDFSHLDLQRGVDAM